MILGKIIMSHFFAFVANLLGEEWFQTKAIYYFILYSIRESTNLFIDGFLMNLSAYEILVINDHGNQAVVTVDEICAIFPNGTIFSSMTLWNDTTREKNWSIIFF